MPVIENPRDGHPARGRTEPEPIDPVEAAAGMDPAELDAYWHTVVDPLAFNRLPYR